MRTKYFVIGLILFLLNPVFASSIGATIDKTYAEINKGDVGKFKISIFSLENKTLDISISSAKIEDLQIDIVPKHFELEGGLTLNPSQKSEWVILDGNKYAKVYNVYIYVRPKEITQNYYNVPITISAAKEIGSNRKGIVQNVVQSLQYTLHIYVPGEIVRKEEFVNLTNPFHNLSNFPAYQLPTVKPTNIYNPPPTKTKETKTKEESSNDNVPTGFFSLPENKQNISLVTIVAIIIVILLVVYLIKR